MELFEKEGLPVNEVLKSATVTDEETIHCINRVKQEYGYLMDPHGAVAYIALEKMLTANNQGIILETAHPVKFPDTVKTATGKEPEMPDSILPITLCKKAVS